MPCFFFLLLFFPSSPSPFSNPPHLINPHPIPPLLFTPFLCSQYNEQARTIITNSTERASLESEIAALKRVEAEHRSLLAQTANVVKNEAAMAELRESHKEKVAAVREAGDAALSRAVQSASQQMAELQRAHALELERTRMEWEAHTSELTKRHGEEISRLKGMVEVAETVRKNTPCFFPPHARTQRACELSPHS